MYYFWNPCPAIIFPQSCHRIFMRYLASTYFLIEFPVFYKEILFKTKKSCIKSLEMIGGGLIIRGRLSEKLRKRRPHLWRSRARRWDKASHPAGSSAREDPDYPRKTRSSASRHTSLWHHQSHRPSSLREYPPTYIYWSSCGRAEPRGFGSGTLTRTERRMSPGNSSRCL